MSNETRSSSETRPPVPGTLFVVATPIGNLEDLTFRALRVLGEVDLIAAEDTRRTSKLLAHYNLQKPLVSLHEHNEGRESDRLIQKLAAGTSVALVSDAGTPTIADPGYQLVGKAHEAGIPVVAVPGASALVAALSISGFPADQFVFMGFPPATGSARDRWFERLSTEPSSVVFYEAPHRIERTLRQLSDELVNRPIKMARELTKINDELVEWDNTSPVRAQGEFVVLVGPGHESPGIEPDASDVAILVGQIQEKLSLSEDTAMTMAAARFAVPRLRVRNLLKKGKILLKRSSDNQQS